MSERPTMALLLALVVALLPVRLVAEEVEGSDSSGSASTAVEEVVAVTDIPLLQIDVIESVVRLIWDPVARATGYRLRYASLTDATIFGEIDLGAATSATYQLNGGETYRVELSGYNDGGAGPRSKAQTFTVAAASGNQPAPPSTAPSLRVDTVGNEVRILWGSVDGATGYRLGYSNMVDLGEFGEIDLGNVTAQIITLAHGSSYRVDIVSYNSAGDGPRSTGQVFTIDAPPADEDDGKESGSTDEEDGEDDGEKVVDRSPYTNGLGMTFLYLDGGVEVIGSPVTEVGRGADEQVWTVTIPPFRMMTTEVTQRQWLSVMGENPSYFSDCLDCPVESVSWSDAQAFVTNLNSTVVGGDPYRLPTEAEWEYAARAGSDTAYPWGEAIAGDYANCRGSECGEGFDSTTVAGAFNANPFGLHDMHGNVWEWLQDCYVEYYTEGRSDGGPRAVSGTCERRVLRGGSWNSSVVALRSANRDWANPENRIPTAGLRLVRIVTE